MKLSSKGRYGVRALFDIAYYSADTPTQIKDISSRQGIPPRFLEQIFQDLRKAGLITSKRGPRGGYQLARRSDQIRLGDIVRALDGPIGAFLGEDSTRKGSHVAKDTRRVTDQVFHDLSIAVEACFDGVSIADMVQKAEVLGLRRGPANPYVYAI